ncbi:MAG: Ribulose-5-phosphate 4-epimerase and related epimerases and aldolases [uncultured Paraburkholderia sp.]|nr:MAG: Ribulose-5-phosphate 4-epimerase and related epimerases and aldolases [uncultured Paraburkholderia sp.]CAH2941321.1 MAG: Ribulose-5-phosphate 4-epimerase and related epimerases and aldolases [uncultured Paraburkholderia sp.]
MTGNDIQIRESIIDSCRRMNALGINQGTSSRNISVRHGDGMLVTPDEHALRRDATRRHRLHER